MMKNFKRLLSLVLTACFIISACTCTTIFAADETIAEKTLKYFDDDNWTIDESNTAGYTQLLDYPNDISLYWNNLQVSKADKVGGVLGKAAEDSSLHVYMNGKTGGNREFGVNLFECTNASSAPDNVTGGDIFTTYVDFAADSIPAGLGYFGTRVLGRNNISNATNNYKDIFSINNDGDGTYSISLGENSVDYTLSTWVNIALEIEFTNENTIIRRAYVDGELLGAADATTLAGLSYMRIGFQKPSSMVATENPSFYVDNVAFYKGAFSKAQYKAIEDASALCVADVIGTNTGLDNIVTNLNLPTTAENGGTITWASSNEAVISNEGEVTPSATEDTEVTLTATIANDNATETKAYTVTVPQNELISFDDIKGKNVYEGSIVSNLSLPDNLRNGTEITWESSNPNIVDTNGNVTRYNDKSNSVTLTAKKASDGTVVKAFELYVIGDDIVNDDASSFDKVYSQGYNTEIRIDEAFREVGFGLAETGKESYVAYNAAPGAGVIIEYATCNGTNKRNCQIRVSETGDAIPTTNFEAFETDASAPYYEFGEAGLWQKNVFTATETLPEGTRYLWIRSGHLLNAYINSVRITSNCVDDITFDDIKGDNTAADKVISNLSIPSGATIVSSSNDGIIGVDGTVTRPEKDTVVTLTMNIANDSVDATKIFTLTVLGTNEEIKSEKPWIFYNSGSGIALINKSTLSNAGTIEFDADVTYYGTATDKKVTGIVAIYDVTGTELIEIKTVEKELLSSPEAQRVETVLTLSKETSEYAGSKVRGFIWESGTITALGEDTIYTAK